MESIVTSVLDDNQVTVMICLMLAVFRIYLEVIGFDFKKLPMTKVLKTTSGHEFAQNFHRMGFYFSVGYLLLFGPTFFLH